MDKLIFDYPASEWLEATPLGNGFLGAMVYGGTDKEVVYLNEDSVVSNGPLDRLNRTGKDHLTEIRELLLKGDVKEVQKLAPRYFYATSPQSPHFEPLGQLWLEFGEREISDYSRTLNMQKGLLDISYGHEYGKQIREAFVSNPMNVFVYKLSSDKQNISFDLYLTRRDGSLGRSSSFADSIYEKNGYLFLESHNGSVDNGVDLTMAVAVKCDGDKQIIGTRLCVDNASSVVIYAVGRSSNRSKDPTKWCLDQLNLVSDQEYKHLKDAHIKDFESLYDKSFFKLASESDEKTASELLDRAKDNDVSKEYLETAFNYGKYLFISSSRKGSTPANMQGIWNYDFAPYWGSRYTININTQINYWFAEELGLSDEHLPLLELFKKMYPNGQKVAKDLYGMRGAVAHHNTDIYGDCAPTDYYLPSTIWPYGLLWLALHAINHYRYTADKDYLMDIFPILNDISLFFIDYLFKDENGTYQTGPSVSPENTFKTKEGVYGSICMSPQMDVSMLKEYFNEYLYVLDKLGSDELRKEVTDRLNHLPGFKTTVNDTIREYQEDYEETELGHRHISQLFSLYPGTDRTLINDFYQQTLNTLDRRVNNGSGNGGWSGAWIAIWYARLGRSKQALDMIKSLLKDYSAENLFSIGTGPRIFQIDGNFGVTTALLECVVQDYGNEVYLLPAVCDELSDGELKGLRLKSGGVININWKDCKLEKFELTATRNLHTKLIIEDKQIEINLNKNESYKG